MSEFIGGWDSDGNYWAAEPSVDGQDDFYSDRVAPYQWALRLQAEVVDQCSQIPFVVDQANRDDIAWETINRLVEENGISQELGQAALFHWRSIYRGVQGEKT